MIPVLSIARPARGTRSNPARRSAQRGVSLIIAMVMLVVIGLVSVSIMRRATSSDQVALNNRLQTQANQFAQAALQFCENEITGTTQPAVIQAKPAAANQAAWTVKSNWLTPTNGVYRLKATDLPGTTPPVAANLPQCLVEHSFENDKLYVVTARGFSDDYTYDSSTGATKTGSVVWLQSKVLVY